MGHDTILGHVHFPRGPGLEVRDRETRPACSPTVWPSMQDQALYPGLQRMPERAEEGTARPGSRRPRGVGPDDRRVGDSGHR